MRGSPRSTSLAGIAAPVGALLVGAFLAAGLATGLEAQSSDVGAGQETAALHWGTRFVWFRATTAGNVLVFASAGYRSAFTQPVTISAEDADQWAKLAEQLARAGNQGAATSGGSLDTTVVLGQGAVILDASTAAAGPRDACADRSHAWRRGHRHPLSGRSIDSRRDASERSAGGPPPPRRSGCSRGRSLNTGRLSAPRPGAGACASDRTCPACTCSRTCCARARTCSCTCTCGRNSCLFEAAVRRERSRVRGSDTSRLDVRRRERARSRNASSSEPALRRERSCGCSRNDPASECHHRLKSLGRFESRSRPESPSPSAQHRLHARDGAPYGSTACDHQRLSALGNQPDDKG